MFLLNVIIIRILSVFGQEKLYRFITLHHICLSLKGKPLSHDFFSGSKVFFNVDDIQSKIAVDSL